MAKPIYCHLNMERFDSDLPIYREMGVGLELAVSAEELDAWKENGTRERIQRVIDETDCALMLHGPIYGYDPASKDPAIADLARRRAMADLEIAALIDPEVIVFHSSYNHYVYGFTKDYWIEKSAAFYRDLLSQMPSGRTRLVIENIFDTDPYPLVDMIQAINDPRVGHCFDIGHFTMFQKEYAADRWLQAFDGKLFHLHLHDNHGEEDLHLPPGDGSIDFSPLFQVLARTPEPWSLTLEGKTPEANRKGVAWIRRNVAGY